MHIVCTTITSKGLLGYMSIIPLAIRLNCLMAILGLGYRKQSPPLSDCTVTVALVMGGVDIFLTTLSLFGTALVLSPVWSEELP